MNGLKKVALLAALLSTILACSKKDASEQLLTIDYESSDILPSSQWYLMTFGANAITLDTIPVSESGQIRYKNSFYRDTLDAMLLLNEQMLLEVPIFTDSLDVKISVKDTLLHLEGVRYSDDIAKWKRMLHPESADVPGDLIDFLREISAKKVTPVLVADLMRRYPKSSCYGELRSLLRTSLTLNSDLDQLLGLSPDMTSYIYDESHRLPEEILIHGKKDSLYIFSKFLGRQNLMLMAFEDARNLTKDEIDSGEVFHRQLDTLDIPSYHVLLFSDTVPQKWSIREKTNKIQDWRYFLVDSTGEASRYAAEAQIQSLPSYFLADSLRYVWREWHERDSVITFLKQLKDKRKK